MPGDTQRLPAADRVLGLDAVEDPVAELKQPPGELVPGGDVRIPGLFPTLDLDHHPAIVDRLKVGVRGVPVPSADRIIVVLHAGPVVPRLEALRRVCGPLSLPSIASCRPLAGA